MKNLDLDAKAEAKKDEKRIIRVIAETIVTEKMKSKTGKAPHGFVGQLLRVYQPSFTFVTRDKVDYDVIKVEKELADNASKLSHIATSAPADDPPESREQDAECITIDSDHSSDPSGSSLSAESANLRIQPNQQQTVLLDELNSLSFNEDGTDKSNSSNNAMNTTSMSSNSTDTPELRVKTGGRPRGSSNERKREEKNRKRMAVDIVALRYKAALDSNEMIGGKRLKQGTLQGMNCNHKQSRKR